MLPLQSDAQRESMDREVAEGHWRSIAPCNENPEMFFPTSERDPVIRFAKLICRTCPVAVQCLDFALSNPDLAEYGVWGGLSEKERQQLMS